MSNGIYQAITAAMGEIAPIAKEKRNKEQGFQYRGVDDVMNCLAPILVKHKIFIYPEVVEKQRQERQTSKGGTLLYSILTIKYHFATEDGSEICVTVVGEGMDSGDKASNKAMAVAFKYACLQMFCIPTEDIVDPDSETPPHSTPKNGNGKPPENNKPTNEQEAEKEKIGKLIGEILETQNPEGKPYFKDFEITNERNDYMKNNLQAVLKQHERLQKWLETRKASFKPSPESEDFQDDILF